MTGGEFAVWYAAIAAIAVVSVWLAMRIGDKRRLSPNPRFCGECGHKWQPEPGDAISGCPECGADNSALQEMYPVAGVPDT